MPRSNRNSGGHGPVSQEYLSAARGLLQLSGHTEAEVRYLATVLYMGDLSRGVNEPRNPRDARAIGGASQEIIEETTVSFKYKVQRCADGQEISETCAICICTFEDNDDIRRLRCKHLFHLKCVDDWLKLKGECPMCRSDIEGKYNN